MSKKTIDGRVIVGRYVGRHSSGERFIRVSSMTNEIVEAKIEPSEFAKALTGEGDMSAKLLVHFTKKTGSDDGGKKDELLCLKIEDYINCEECSDSEKIDSIKLLVSDYRKEFFCTKI